MKTSSRPGSIAALAVALCVLLTVAWLVHLERSRNAGRSSAATGVEQQSRSATQSQAGNAGDPDGSPPTAADEASDIDSADPFIAFASWLKNLPPQADDETIERGVTLAAARRPLMRELIWSDPQAALARALTLDQYAALPDKVRALVEQPFSTRAEIDVFPHCDGVSQVRDPAVKSTQEVDLHVNFSSAGNAGIESLDGFTHGWRLGAPSRSSSPVQGIRIDRLTALRPAIFQQLSAPEIAAAEARFPIANPDPARGIATGRALAEQTVVALAGGKLYRFADQAAFDSTQREATEFELADTAANRGAAEFLARLAAAAGGDGDDNGAAAAAGEPEAAADSYRTAICIRVQFPDGRGGATTQSAIQTMMTTSDLEFQKNSFNKIGLTFEVTSEKFMMPQPSEYYNGDLDGTRRSSTLFNDAVALAQAAGYDTNKNHRMVFHGGMGMGYGGLGTVGGSKTWYATQNVKVIMHEIGHNLTLQHGSAWIPTDGADPLGGGSTGEYTDTTTYMGGGTNPNGHFSVYEKKRKNWITSAQLYTFGTGATNATYRIYRFDHQDVTGDRLGIEVRRTNNLGEFWLGYRQNYAENSTHRHLKKGVQVNWERPNVNNRAHLVYTTANGGRSRAAVPIGKTFTDPYDNLHVTVLKRGGSSPNQWIDVQVRRGDFPSNNRPTIETIHVPTHVAVNTSQVVNTTATDADGDQLVYSFDFKNDKVTGNDGTSAQRSFTWTTTGQKTITVSVSDRKGGLRSKNQTVQLVANSLNDPLNLLGEPLSDRNRLTWNAVSGASSYSVYRSTIGDSRYALLIGTASGSIFEDTDVEADDGAFYYWVQAIGNNSASSFSPVEVVDSNVLLFARGDSFYAPPGIPIRLPVLQNDSSAPGEPLMLATFTQGQHGVVTNNGDGTLSYTANAGHLGSDSFNYAISNGAGGGDGALVQITVANHSDRFTAVPENPGFENQAVSPADSSDGVEGWFDDSSAGGARTEWEGASGTPLTPRGMNWAGLGSGSFIYQQIGNWEANQTLNIAGLLGRPQAGGFPGITITLLAGGNAALAADGVDLGAVGASVIATSGSIQPALDELQSEAFEVSLNTGSAHAPADPLWLEIRQAPGAGRTVVDDISIWNAGNSNRSPVFLDAPVMPADATEHQPYSAPLSGAATDPDGDDNALLYYLKSAPPWLQLSAAGTFSGTPPNGIPGSHEFTLVVVDADGAFSTRNAVLRVININDDPVALDDFGVIAPGFPLMLPVLANDTDRDLQALSIASFTQPAFGTVTDNGDGSLSYTSPMDSGGVETFSYTASDGSGGSDVASVQVTVNYDHPRAAIALGGNRSFEDPPVFPADYAAGIAGWFDGGVGPTTRTESERATSVPDTPFGENWASLGPSDWMYQQIGQWRKDRTLTVSGLIGRKDGVTQVRLYAGGNASLAADGVDPAATGATLIAQSDLIDPVHNDGEMIHFDVSLNTGSTSYAGQPLWLEIKQSNQGGRLLIDHVNVWDSAVNALPRFQADHLRLTAAEGYRLYSGSLAGHAFDPDSAEGALIYVKVSGPDWLQVAVDGTLSGHPDNSSTGNNNFVFAVVDDHGASSIVSGQIEVTTSGVPGLEPLNISLNGSGAEVIMRWRDEAGAAGYVIECASDLNWEDKVIIPVSSDNGSVDADSSPGWIRFQFTNPMGPDDAAFFRVRAVEDPPP